MQGDFCLSAPTDELSNAEISAFYDSKITEAETLMATLCDRLGEGEEDQLQDFSSVVSMIPCVSCATLPEQQQQRRRKPHLVDKLRLTQGHRLQLLSDIGKSKDLILTVSTMSSNKNCPLYGKPNFLNHSGIRQSSQIRLGLGEEGETVFQSEQNDPVTPKTTYVKARKNGRAERRRVWVDYALCSHIALVKQYSEAYKAAKMEFLAHLNSSAGEDA